MEISLKPSMGNNLQEGRDYHGSFTLGGSGAVASSDLPGGFATIVKTAAKTARYSVTVHRGFARMIPGQPVIQGPADAAMGNTAANAAVVRNVNPTAGTFDIQLLLASSGADTESTSGNKVYFHVFLSDFAGP
jgi:hypothetical protein